MTVIKRVQSTYNSILRAKAYFFFRKSIWLYLLGMLLLGYALPLAGYGALFSGLLYFVVFIAVVVVPVYHFSSKALAEKIGFDADMEFSEQHIVVKHRNKDQVETKEWTWVKRIDITGNAVFLVVAEPTRFVITLDRQHLTESELHFFQQVKGNTNS
jgi:hypothetical protein